MCGIAAVFAYGESAPPVDREEVLNMRERMLSRGPDGAGQWFSDDGRVGFGHRRLSIIDLSPAGAQPMFNADRSLAIIFNGEIYNYRELRQKLIGEGRHFQSHCDTEVLLELYAKRGEAMTEELRGMYAFAIWDRDKQGIFLARDPFGIKPLYYSDNGHTFRLASQVKPLREGGKIDSAPDPAGHVGYFLWGHVPDPYTLYRKIRSVPAGCTMWIDRNGAKSPRKFCDISSILADAESDVRGQMSDLSSAERLRSALEETVRYHLVADVPVGVFLSSGLDSTTIAALAAKQGGILRTVTLGFEEYKSTAADETPLAEEFAKRCGATHQTIWVSRADFEAERDHLFEAMDRPTTDGVNTFFVSLAAKQANLKVALSGVGGDELFGSYPSFRDIPRTVGFLKAFRHWRSFGTGLRILSAPVLKRFTSPKYASMFEYGGTYSGAYLLRRGMFMPWELPELLDPEMVRAGWQELQTLLRLDETLDGIRNPRLKVSALEMSWYMRNQLLRDSDWAGMGNSVEIRVPFVDVDLLKSVAPLLASKHPPTKRDMAQTPSFQLPSSILGRPKTGFQIPVGEWLLKDPQPSTFPLAKAFGVNPQLSASNRGLRGWAREVYSHFITDSDDPAKSFAARRLNSPRKSSHRPVPGRLQVLMLLSDAFGGSGGIAKFNRDFITALSTSPDVERIVAIPRIASGKTDQLPPKLTYVTDALAGKAHFMRAILAAACGLRANGSTPNGDPIVICAHINILPAAVLARGICGGPLYLIIHGVEAWKQTRNPIANACVRRIDDFISVSAVTRKRFLRWAGLRQDQGIILPNCVDLSAFTPGQKSRSLIERYGLKDRAVLLTVGRLAVEERYKGVDEVIEVLPRLVQKIPNLVYLIVGDGADRGRLQEKARNLGMKDRVVFAGKIPESEKADHYRLADVYIMPGYGEGFGIVYLEALACGIPVIGSKTDGSRDALRNGKLGILVDPTDSAEIEAAVVRMLHNKAQQHTTNGALGANDTVEYFSSKRFARRVHRIIAEIVGARNQ
jgi:asparagine synthase (glutamine-hydrolysing)